MNFKFKLGICLIGFFIGPIMALAKQHDLAFVVIIIALQQFILVKELFFRDEEEA